jgi:hemerythrin-like domain-containing protein
MRNDAARLAAALTSMASPDERRAAAIARWYQGFLTEFHGHHTIEDDFFFPALAERVAQFDGVIARVDREHAALNSALESVGQSVEVLASRGVRWTEARADALGCAAEAVEILTAHLDFEDDEILPLFERHMSAEEYEELNQKALKHNTFKALLFAVPWVVSQTTPQEKTEVLAMAPMPMRVIWRATRGRYARLERDVFGGIGATDELVSAATGRGVA